MMGKTGEERGRDSREGRKGEETEGRKGEETEDESVSDGIE
jgi:hypothetical protein